MNSHSWNDSPHPPPAAPNMPDRIGATWPKVSVITVVLNAEDAVRATAQSVAQQTYPYIEHVIKDGGSSDRTLDVAVQYIRPAGRLTSTEDTGIYDAMNQALALCTGDLILFLNAGDLFFQENSLENFVRHCYRGPDRIYLCAVTTKSLGVLRPRWVWLKRHYMLPVCHQGIIYPAAAFFQNRYEPRYRIVADFEHFARAARVWRLEVADLVLSVFDETGVSTLNKAEMHQEYRAVYRDLGVHPLFRLLKAAHEVHEGIRSHTTPG